jgi:nucleotidyltransferase/DNA polymerase involved in DNA repair
MAPETQPYSIDECFLDITGISDDLDEYCLKVQTNTRGH